MISTHSIKRKFFFHPGDGAGHSYDDVLLSVVALTPKAAHRKVKRKYYNYAAFYLIGAQRIRN